MIQTAVLPRIWKRRSWSTLTVSKCKESLMFHCKCLDLLPPLEDAGCLAGTQQLLGHCGQQAFCWTQRAFCVQFLRKFWMFIRSVSICNIILQWHCKLLQGSSVSRGPWGVAYCFEISLTRVGRSFHLNLFKRCWQSSSETNSCS